MILPVKTSTGVVRSRPSAPHPPLSAVAASQFTHCDAPVFSLRRTPPSTSAQDAAMFLLPQVQNCACGESCLSCGCQLIGLSVPRITEITDSGSVALAVLTRFEFIDTVEADLKTVYVIYLSAGKLLLSFVENTEQGLKKQ